MLKGIRLNTLTSIYMRQSLKRITLPLLFVILSLPVFAQYSDTSLVQFSGIVVTADSIQPVPYTHIAVEGKARGAVADYQGFFSFVARKGEVIVFSAMGFKQIRFRIPDSLQADRYSLIQVLQVDTITLSETVIYPWPTRAQFKEAFLTLEVPMNDYDRAMDNLARAELKERMLSTGMDASGNYRAFVGQQAYNYGYKGLQPQSLTGTINNPLLNPFAWAEFIKAWKQGKFKVQQ